MSVFPSLWYDGQAFNNDLSFEHYLATYASKASLGPSQGSTFSSRKHYGFVCPDFASPTLVTVSSLEREMKGERSALTINPGRDNRFPISQFTLHVV